MELINNFIITLVTTLIFITAIEIIGPDNSMKKYVKFVLGLILIAVLLNPIINFFLTGEGVVTKAIDKYEKEIAESSSKIKTSKDEEKLREESFKDNLNKNCVSLLSNKFEDYNFKSEIECEVDFTNMTFKVNKLIIGIQKKGIKKIEQVDLSKEKSKENNDDSIQKAIKKFLSEEVKVEEEKIQVYYL
jgi:stage III sporulation protein AF